MRSLLRFLIPAMVVLAAIVITNTAAPVYRPPIAGVLFFAIGLTIYPFARKQHPPFLARYVADGDRLVFSRYVMTWIGISMLFAAIQGMITFR